MGAYWGRKDPASGRNYLRPDAITSGKETSLEQLPEQLHRLPRRHSVTLTATCLSIYNQSQIDIRNKAKPAEKR